MIIVFSRYDAYFSSHGGTFLSSLSKEKRLKKKIFFFFFFKNEKPTLYLYEKFRLILLNFFVSSSHWRNLIIITRVSKNQRLVLLVLSIVYHYKSDRKS